MTRIERFLVATMVMLAILGGVGWFANAPRTRTAATALMPSLGTDARLSSLDSIDAAARTVAATDPFRFDRRPTSVRYRPDLEVVPSQPKAPRPQLVLSGLVGRAALLDGIPGRSATAIVSAGDTMGGLTIRRVGRDTVIVAGADTTWRLTLRAAWQ